MKLILKYLLGIFFILAGFNHFREPDFYLKIMPAYLPWHLFLVYLSGGVEMVLGALVLIPKFTRIAGWGLIALLIAILPANLQMVMHRELYPQFNSTLLWLRLPLQGVFIAWAYWYTRPDRPTDRPVEIAN